MNIRSTGINAHTLGNTKGFGIMANDDRYNISVPILRFSLCVSTLEWKMGIFNGLYLSQLREFYAHIRGYIILSLYEIIEWNNSSELDHSFGKEGFLSHYFVWVGY